MSLRFLEQVNLGFATLAVGAVLAFAPVVAQAEDTATEAATEGGAELPSLGKRFEEWTSEALTFSGVVTNRRRSRPDFSIQVDDVRYSVLFDAGRAKRNAILDCLDLSYSCELKGTGFMRFEHGKMKLNVTDVTWLAIPAIDFDVVGLQFHRCVRSEQYKRKKFASVVEAKLEILDLNRPPSYTLEPVKPRDGGRGFDIVDRSVEDCMRRSIRLPVGSYSMKVFTQSSDVFLDYWDE